MTEKTAITEKIKDQILDIRFIDAADMHDVEEVRFEAVDIGHDELVEFLDKHREEYIAYIDTGEVDRIFTEAMEADEKRRTRYYHVAGTLDFHGSVDITDPCYDRDVWCRMNDVKIAEGKYTCYIYRNDAAKDPWDANCITTIGICLDWNISTRQVFKQIGTIGVDAGLAGFFHNKPDYGDEEWSRLCGMIDGEDTFLEDGSFFSSSGYGDGEYPVFAEKNRDGEIVALEIRFIEEDETEEDEE